MAHLTVQKPARRCVGCGRTDAKTELLRFTNVAGRLELDPDGRASGRGAYLHPNADCAREAVRRRGFERSLRAAVALPDDLLHFPVAWRRSASTR
jgi:uncharacterized protein